MRCPHSPRCPASDAADAAAARLVADHGEQGWFLLCNGIIMFDDGGWLAPDAAQAAREQDPPRPAMAGPGRA